MLIGSDFVLNYQEFGCKACCANNVGSCCVRVGSGLQTDAKLSTSLGPAVHRGKDTTHKSL